MNVINNHKYEQHCIICLIWTALFGPVRSGDDLHRDFSRGATGDLVAKSPKHKRVLCGISVVPSAKHDLHFHFENPMVPILDVDFERSMY